MSEEIWKSVPGFEGYYEVSNTGKVRSLDRTIKTAKGILVFFKGKQLSLHKSHGHLRIGLEKNNKNKKFFVHRLVWLAFNGKIPEGKEINHIDGVKINNNLSNLELVTRKEHHKRTIKQRLQLHGSKHPKAKINERIACELKQKIKDEKYSGYGGLTKLAREYNIPPTIIYNLKYYNLWRYV